MQLSARSVILVAAVVGGLMLAPIPDFGRVQGAVFDLMHAPLCAVLAWAAFHGFRRRLPAGDVAAWVLVVAAVFAAGVAVEFAQAFTGRKGSLKDITANGLGAMAAMVWALRAAQSTVARQRGFALLTAGLFCAAAARPAVVLATAARERLGGSDHVSSTVESESAGGDGT